MIFAWLRRCLAPLKATDKLWLDDAAKWRGLCDEITAARDAGCTVLAVAHFEKTLAVLEAALCDRSIAFRTCSSFDLDSLCSGLEPPGVCVAQSRSIRAQTNPAGRGGGARVLVVVAERYPTRDRDDALLLAAASLPRVHGIVYHLALSDPVLVPFGTERIRKLAETLGVGQDECLNHRFIANAIRSAQKRIAKQVPHEASARSAEDWFKSNLPASP